MSEPLFVLATGYRLLYTVLGGYVVARLTPSEPMRHVWILAGIGTLAATLGAAATWNRPELGPQWYPLALVITAVPSVWLGGRIALRGLDVATTPAPK